MNSFYLYRADSGGHRNILVCYVASASFDINKFTEVIKKSFDGSPFSEQLVLIAAEFNRRDILDKLLENEAEITRLKQSINNYQALDIHLATIKFDGGVLYDQKIDSTSKSKFKLPRNFKNLVECGLIDIIERHNLIMESSPVYHFVKPSGKHASRFIKASNVMQRSSEISFLAINILRYTKSKIDRIYTDTAGIFPLAYELIAIRRQFDEPVSCDFIDSFGSYSGLDSYFFSGGENTLVLISASTSDDLSNRLRLKAGLSQANIISVFSSSASSNGSSLVDFKHFYHAHKNQLFAPIVSSAEHECDLCIYEKSIPLSLSNSQFVFEAPKNELYLPLAKDSDKALRGVVSNYKNSNAFKCLYDGLDGTTTPTPEYFIDVSALVEGNLEYQIKIENFVTRSFPLSADLIIHANDQGALDLAKKIQDKVRKLRRKVRLTSISELDNNPPKKGVVIVAGSIQTGKSLLDISRKLRSFSKLPITYVIGFAKYNDPASYLKLKRDLTFNNGCPSLGSHQFVAIDELMLPLTEHRINAWQKELDVLKALTILSKSKKTTDAILSREKKLRQATDKSSKGMGEHIFLPSPVNKNMILGETFAFWDEKDSKDKFSHQATVYFTLSNILQGLRYSKISLVRPPLGDGYTLRQLDPLIFDRFNEGIIQASILRSAKPKELNYSASDTSSSIAGSLIERMINEPELSTSEALPEFLLALCTAKLQIKKDHIKNMCTLFLEEDKYPLTSILLEYAKTLLFPEANSEPPPVLF